MEVERNGTIAFERGGAGDALLVLVHGLAATARVWAPMLEQAPRRWPGRWIALDLRGHGGSASRDRYAIADYAEDVARLVENEVQAGPITLLGHSLGGVVALALAEGTFGIYPAAVYGLGIKVAWSDTELARMAELSTRPTKSFASRDEAVVHYGRQSGLGKLESDSPLAERGVLTGDGGWRTAVDMRAYAIAAPPMAEMIASAQCPVRLARGGTDPMVSLEQLRAFDKAALSIVDAGHNAMVDAPDAVWAWLGAR
jgi:pimeloyl-ACP methyl ester carboxylesterase